jgi:hypothetical protein
MVLRGSSGHWRPGLVVGGLALMLVVLATGVRWALRRKRDGHPFHPGFAWAIGGLAAFYVALAIGGSIAGTEYALAALLAGIIPLSALALLIATIRRKTDVVDDRLVDASADADDDSLPGIGLDQDTPVGETSELHDLDREDPPDRRFQRKPPAVARENRQRS